MSHEAISFAQISSTTLIWKYYSFVKQKDRELFCPQARINVYQIRKSLIYFD